MSGPKCASYRVDPAVLAAARRQAEAQRLAEARRQAEAQRQAAAHEARNQLIERIEALDAALAARRRMGLVEVSPWQGVENPAGTSTDEIEAWNAEVRAALDRAETELAQVERSEHQREMRLRLEAVASGGAAQRIRQRAAVEAVATDIDEPVAGTVHQSPHEEGDHDRGAEIDALIERLPHGASAEERAAIDRKISMLADAPAAEFSSMVVSAKAEMQRVERAITSRAEMRCRAAELLTTLEGLEGAEIEGCRSLLHRAADGRTPLLQADIERIERARAKAAADFERRFVASKIEEAFKESGVEVGATFGTDVLDGERAYAAARSSDEHAVEVRLRDGQVDLRLVRASGTPDARHDRDAEIEFCKDLGRISAALHSQGVDLELVSHRPPGAVEVEVVTAARSALATRPRRGTKTIERTHKP